MERLDEYISLTADVNTRMDGCYKVSDLFQEYHTRFSTDDVIKIFKTLGQCDDYYLNLDDPENKIRYASQLEECVSQLISIFNFSKFNPSQFGAISKLFLQLCWTPELSADARLKLANTLFVDDETRVLSFQCYSRIVEEPLNLVLVMQAASFLFSSNSPKHMQQVAAALDKAVTNPKLPSEYVYKLLSDFLIQFTDPKRRDYLVDVVWTFLCQNHHEINQKILASSYLLENRALCSDIKIKGVFIFLISTMENKQKTVLYNQRADAADTVDRYGNPEQRRKAKDILELLGGDKTNVYNNAQSSHAVSESVEKFLLELKEKKIILEKYGAFNEKIRNQLKELCERNSKYRKAEQSIQGALDRIAMDMTKFCGMDVREIIQRVYNKIYDTADLDDRNGLIERFYQELIDSYGTCISGHVNRLANVFIGAVKISWDAQILSNFSARINALIKHIPDADTDLKGNIIVGSMLVDDDPEKFDEDEKEAFEAYTRFIRESYPVVKKELWAEFVGESHVTDDAFETTAKKYLQGIKITV